MEFYHLLNRGVDKRNIFLNKKDYFRFIHNLFEFNDTENVSPNNNRFFVQLMDVRRPSVGRHPSGGKVQKKKPRARKLLVNIHFFCLMPNHYHLLVSPLAKNGIPLFMKKLNMGYSKYFNEKNKRVGALFQGKYKSVHIKRDAHFLWLPYYIHFNPLDLKMPEWREGKIRNSKKASDYLRLYRWSSHLDYLGTKNFPSVTQRDFFLEYFGGEKKYAQSIDEHLQELNISEIKDVLLE